MDKILQILSVYLEVFSFIYLLEIKSKFSVETLLKTGEFDISKILSILIEFSKILKGFLFMCGLV